MFVIHKSSRSPDPVTGSYQGNTWFEAGISNEYQSFYTSKKMAEQIANKLTKANPVGFIVSEIELQSNTI